MYLRISLTVRFDLEKSGKNQENFYKKSGKIYQLDLWQACIRNKQF